MDRDKFEFRYYFNAGINKATGMCDEEGSDVFDDNYVLHYIGSLPYIYPGDIADMTDEELEVAFDQNMIFPNTF